MTPIWRWPQRSPRSSRATCSRRSQPDGKPYPSHRLASPNPLRLPKERAGDHELRFEFEFEPTGAPDVTHGRAAPGTLQLQVDETLEVLADVITALAVNPGTLTCGANPGSPVTPDYAPPFRFTGTLRTVILDVSGDIADTESEGHLAMARQ